MVNLYFQKMTFVLWKCIFWTVKVCVFIWEINICSFELFFFVKESFSRCNVWKKLCSMRLLPIWQIWINLYKNNRFHPVSCSAGGPRNLFEIFVFFNMILGVRKCIPVRFERMAKAKDNWQYPIPCALWAQPLWKITFVRSASEKSLQRNDVGLLLVFLKDGQDCLYILAKLNKKTKDSYFQLPNPSSSNNGCFNVTKKNWYMLSSSHSFFHFLLISQILARACLVTHSLHVAGWSMGVEWA